MIPKEQLDELERLACDIDAMPRGSLMEVTRQRARVRSRLTKAMRVWLPDLIADARRAHELKEHCAYLMRQVEELDRTLAEREREERKS